MAEAVFEKTKEAYLRQLGQVSNGVPEWLKTIRVRGKETFEATPLPHTRLEEWRQTNIGEINKVHFDPLTQAGGTALKPEDAAKFYYAPDAWTELVFVDGFFAEHLSCRNDLPGGVRAGNLASAAQGAPEVVEAHLNRYLRDRNAYTALNTALIQDGAFVHVPKNTDVETPIHLIFVTTKAAADRSTLLRNLIVLEESAEAQVVCSYVSLAGDAAYLTNAVDEVALAPNAHLKLYKLAEEGVAGNHLATTEVHHEKDSSFKSFVYTLSGRVVRNQICTRLEGAGANSQLTGLYLNDGDRLIDNMLSITHVAPGCNSRIAYKGILDGRSKAVFAGKVYVHPEAQQTDSDQLSNNLLLSDSATIDTKPQLEIYADDVKCTHGATVGAPPEEVIFYFRTRGIDEATARGMLTYGFADELVEEIEIPEIKAQLGQYIFEKYSPKF